MWGGQPNPPIYETVYIALQTFQLNTPASARHPLDPRDSSYYTKAYHIICSLCRSTHLESNTIRFSIL